MTTVAINSASSRPSLSGSTAIVVVLVILTSVLFAASIDFLMRGDATTYATYALIGKWDDLTLHMGYYATIAVLHHTIGAVLGIPIHEMLAYANVAFGALATGVVFLLAEALLGSRLVAVITAVYFAIGGRVIMNATSSEIYMLQTLVVTSSMLLYVHERPFVAGLMAGFGLLVSPLSAFAYLFFPAWELTRPNGRNWQTFGLLVAGGTLVYLPYLLMWWQELFWGRRGLLSIREVTPIDLREMLANSVKYQIKHFSALLLLLPVGIAAWRSYTRLLWLTAAVAVPHLYIVSKLTEEDNTFLLNTDAFFCLWLAIGTGVLWSKRPWKMLALVPAVAHLTLYIVAGVLFSGQTNRVYATDMRQVADAYLKGKNAVMVTDWDVTISLTHFGRDSAVSIPEEDPLFRQMYDLDTRVGPWPSLENTEIYLLDPWAPSPLNKLLRSEATLAELRRESSVLGKAQRRLGLECTELDRPTHVLYRCQKVRRGTRG